MVGCLQAGVGPRERKQHLYRLQEQAENKPSEWSGRISALDSEALDLQFSNQVRGDKSSNLKFRHLVLPCALLLISVRYGQDGAFRSRSTGNLHADGKSGF